MIGETLRVRYEVTNHLREDPLFSVYSARDLLMNREVCVRLVKSPMAGEQSFLDKLGEVAQKLSEFDSPAVQKMLAVDSDEKATFLVSEPPKGGPLVERVRKLAPFSAAVAVATAIGICDGLAALHRTGICHGDVGIHNVNVTTDGEAQIELPSIWEAFSASQSSGALMLPLMAPYLAPEVSGGALPTPQSDVYGLGIILFELLTGRLPYQAETPLATAVRHNTQPTPTVRLHNPSVPMVLDEIVKKAMSKDPSKRYANAVELLSDLRMLQDALRFGRSLSWPIIAGSKIDRSAPAVAPTMSAIEDSDKKERRKKSSEDDAYSGDVPVWVKVTIAFLMGLVAFLVLGYIVFFLKRPEEIKVPAIAGLTVSEATSQLKARGLELRIAEKQPSEQIPAEQIIETSPKGGEKVRKGSQVSVIVSAGSKFVEVPDLRGLTVDKAKMMLGSVNLRLDSQIEEVRARDVEAGMIVGTVPEWGKKVERLSLIKVRVSTGSKNPDKNRSQDRYLYSIHVRVTGTDQNVLLRIDMTDAEGTKTVHESDQAPGADVDVQSEGYGKEATFRIYYDGVLVKQVQQNADEPAIGGEP